MDSNIYSIQSERGGLIRETKLPMQELVKECRGLCAREGRNCGILQYIFCNFGLKHVLRVLKFVTQICMWKWYRVVMF